MISPYLHSLAATVRDLVASGKAVHVTHETAAELDLLAGLPWNQAPLFCSRARDEGIQVTSMPSITPADLALGWLLASRAQPQEDYIEGPNDVVRIERILDDGAKRAAECAELAKEAAQMLVLKRAAQIVPMPWTAEIMGPYLAELQAAATGTREGARAAWAFVVESLQHRLRLRVVELDSQTFLSQAPIPLNDSQVAICDRYRRELEAM